MNRRKLQSSVITANRQTKKYKTSPKMEDPEFPDGKTLLILGTVTIKASMKETIRTKFQKKLRIKRQCKWPSDIKQKWAIYKKLCWSSSDIGWLHISLDGGGPALGILRGNAFHPGLAASLRGTHQERVNRTFSREMAQRLSFHNPFSGRYRQVDTLS